ncbi:MAG: ZIP family metal transporter [Planctomycetia bacterium]|nr:ZIP family metal transporter [Planctomycetia bacterium]
MHPVVLLVIYCGFSVVASLAGGWVPLVVRLTHRRMQIAISFVAGMMLGIGLLHLLPHSFQVLLSIDATVLWAMAGFLFMFFLERFFHFHHHDVPDDDTLPGESRPLRQHAHGASDQHHDHSHDHAVLAKTSSIFPWSGAVIGLTLHSLVDGVAMAAAVKAEETNSLAIWAGFGAFLAIALHKPFDSLTIGTLMAAGGRGPSSRHLVNALYSLVTPLGVALFYVASASLGPRQAGLGQSLGFAAGAFVCIATSDLLPELQFHRHDRSTLSLALLAGIALAWSTVFFEGGGHDHVHSPGTHAEEHDHGGPH